YGVVGNFDFANIAVWSSAIFQRIPPHKKISFIPIIADWIGQGARLGGLVMNDGKWFNISSRAEYLEVHRTILRENWKPDFVKAREWPERVASGANVDSSAQLLAAQLWDETAASARKRFWTTQFCGRMQKLLPKAG